MGKNSAIKSLGKCIGNVAMHELLLKHTNIPESKKHINDEIRDYGADVAKKAKQYTWNSEEKATIEDKAHKRVKRLLQDYPDIVYEDKEITEFITKEMEMIFE